MDTGRQYTSMSEIYVDRYKAKKQEEEETLPSSMAVVESEVLLLYYSLGYL